MRTLNSTNFSPTDGYFTIRDHPTAEYREPEIARKEIPVRAPSPSQSSFFSSPPGSPIQWTPDTASDFSTENSALIGSRTPPPGYSSTTQSLREHYSDEPPRWNGGRSQRDGLGFHMPPPEEQPQSMSDVNGFGNDNRQTSRSKRQHLRQVLGRVVHVSIILCILGTLYGVFKSWNHVSLSLSYFSLVSQRHPISI